MMAIALFLLGCIVQCVSPIYTNDQLVSNPDIEGFWDAPNFHGTWEINESEDGYILEQWYCPITWGGTIITTYELRLAEIEGILVMDVYPIQNPGTDATELGDWSDIWALTGHTVFIVDEMSDDSISLRYLFPVEENAEELYSDLPTTTDLEENLYEYPVLDMSTEEFQELILKSLDEEYEDYWLTMELDRIDEPDRWAPESEDQLVPAEQE